jgi:hypothetical protein
MANELSADGVGDILAPASAVRAPEQRPPAAETDRKKRHRSNLQEEGEDVAGTAEDGPVHQVDDLA